MSRLESNKKLVKLFRDAIENFEDAIRTEILPGGPGSEESKSNLFDFYLGDEAIDLAGGNENGARKLFIKYLDEFLDKERAKTAEKPAEKKKPAAKKSAKKKSAKKKPAKKKPAKSKRR